MKATQSTATNTVQSNVQSLAGNKGSASFQAAQFYYTHDDDDLPGVIATENDEYFLDGTSNNESIFGSPDSATPLYSDYETNQDLTYTYTPEDTFVADCLHTAEEIMHNQRFDYNEGATRSRETTTDGLFGDSKESNWQTAQGVNDNARNRNAAPALGNAYVITAQNPVNISGLEDDDEDAVFCQYHAAAVVATDGNDHITLEIFGSPDGAEHDTDGEYSIYNSAPDSGLTFHDTWINTFANGITISVEPVPQEEEGDNDEME